MKYQVLVTAITIALVSTACGDAGFNGGGKKKVDAERAAGSDGDDGAGADGGGKDTDKPGSGDATTPGGNLDGPPENATPEQTAIGKCLQAWGQHPFDKTVYDDYRKIHAAVTVFGGGGYAVEDTEVTTGPKLIVITAAVSVLGQANYLLMNPNGWYCMMVDVNVMSKSNIDLNCTAKLADTKVNVNVGSKTQNTAAVGVNVFSDVKVNRKKDANSEPGC